MEFKKAERKQVKIKIGIAGPSGSGKSYSALRLAKGLGNKVAAIDTENGSLSMYDHFGFDVVDVDSPYTTDKYEKAIDAAINAGYDVLVIDSLSHAWAGEGGILDAKSVVDARGGNSYTNWASFTAKQNKFIQKILNAPIHVICTFRSKTEYIMQENERGKLAPKKVGLAPIQRDGVEYELAVMFDVAMNHTAITSKDRTGVFADKVFTITEDTGLLIKSWLENGAVQVRAMDTTELVDLAEQVKDPSVREKAIDAIMKIGQSTNRYNEIKEKLVGILSIQ